MHEYREECIHWESLAYEKIGLLELCEKLDKEGWTPMFAYTGMQQVPYLVLRREIEDAQAK